MRPRTDAEKAKVRVEPAVIPYVFLGCVELAAVQALAEGLRGCTVSSRASVT